LANAERLTRLSTEAYGALYDGEHAALAALASVWKRVGELAAIDPRFLPYVEERASLKSSLEDLAAFLRSYAADLESSPERLQAVEGRLAALERLKRKFGPSLADVLARQRDLREELAALGVGEEEQAALAAKEEAARSVFLERARSLSAARRQAAGKLAR